MSKFHRIEGVMINFDHVAMVRNFHEDGVPFEGQPDWKTIITFSKGNEVYTTVAKEDIFAPGYDGKSYMVMPADGVT